ncbi:MAG: hypothetical protein WEC35_03065 [Nitrosopumilaceae archaeon]
MFGKNKWKEGDYVFSSKPDGDYKNVIVGIVTGVEDSKIGVNGIIINAVGLKNKISQGKAGPRSIEILKNPNPTNCILALIYRVEHENFTDVLDVNSDPAIKIDKKAYAVIDGWIRESLPEMINNVLSLSDGSEKDQAKRILKQRMDTLYDKELKKHLYSICRSLKILT